MVIFASQGGSIVLPSPKLGDTERLDLRTVYRRMMDGSIYSYIKGPVIRTFTLEFADLNRPKVAEFISFLEGTAGKEVTYTDYNLLSWRGRIMNFPFDAVHASIRNNTFQIVFEGKAVSNG